MISNLISFQEDPLEFSVPSISFMQSCRAEYRWRQTDTDTLTHTNKHTGGYIVVKTTDAHNFIGGGGI